MKHLVTLFILLIFFKAGAQDVLKMPMARTTAGLSTTPSVLAAYAHCTSYNGVTFVPTDSGVLSYSPGRSYNAKTATYQYDSIYGYGYSGFYNYNMAEVQNFDDSNNVLTDLIVRKNQSTGTWMDSFITTYTYDVNKNILSMTTQVLNVTTGTWINIAKHQYANDINDNRILDEYQVWKSPGGIWENVTKHSYGYDSKNNLIADISLFWIDSISDYVPDTGVAYTFNSSNKITTFTVSGWDPVNGWAHKWRYEYEYDNLTHILTDKRYELTYTPSPGSPGWATQYYIYFTFDTAGNVQEEKAPSTFDYLYTYDTAHNMLSGTYITYNMASGPYIPSYRYLYSYNNYHQLTIYTSQLFNNSTATWLGQNQYRYYYKAAPPPKKTGVNNIIATSGSVQVYPSPANNILNIDISWEKEQPAVAAIYDVQGRIWSQWKIETTNFSHNNIPVSQLPSGNYIVIVKSGQEQITEKFSVIH